MAHTSVETKVQLDQGASAWNDEPVLVNDSPRRVTVTLISSSRYSNNQRPESWDDRHAGLDSIVTSTGEKIVLFSDGGQSPPQPGWIILVSATTYEGGSLWTLYSMPAATSTAK